MTSKFLTSFFAFATLSLCLYPDLLATGMGPGGKITVKCSTPGHEPRTFSCDELGLVSSNPVCEPNSQGKYWLESCDCNYRRVNIKPVPKSCISPANEPPVDPVTICDEKLHGAIIEPKLLAFVGSFGSRTECQNDLQVKKDCEDSCFNHLKGLPTFKPQYTCCVPVSEVK